MPQLLTAEETASLLRCTVARVYDLVASGDLLARRVRPRGRLLFDPADVERALRPAAPPRLPEPAAV